MRSVTVVGNGVAGWACVKELAKAGCEVTLVGPGMPHDRPPLSKRALTSGRMPWLTSPEDLREMGVRHVDAVAVELDLERRQLGVAPMAGAETDHHAFDRLVWATGFAFPRPPIPGLTDVRVFQNHDAAGASRLHERLASGPGRVVVIGAGLVGTETAATAARMGHAVTLVDVLPRPLNRLPEAAGDAALGVLARLGVSFLGECRIAAVTQDDDHVRVLTTTHGGLECETLVVAAGFASTLPDGLVAGAPLTIDVDDRLRVLGERDVWACGDCVAFPHPRWGRITIPHWDHALASGRHVAASILGADSAYRRDPYWFTDIGPLRMQLVGHAPSVTAWNDEDGMQIGRDTGGDVVAVLLIDSPGRLNEARQLVATDVAPGD